jgi:hypothetical protein
MMVAIGLLLSFTGAAAYALESYFKERQKNSDAKKRNKIH